MSRPRSCWTPRAVALGVALGLGAAPGTAAAGPVAVVLDWPVESLPTIAPTPQPDARPARATSPTVDGMKRKRVAWGQVGAGTGFLAVGIAGFGVLGGGLFLHQAREREIQRLAERPDVDPANLDLAPLEAQARRAKIMIGAGTVMSAAGLALGTALLVSGVRDVKALRRQRRLSMSFGRRSVSMSVRF